MPRRRTVVFLLVVGVIALSWNRYQSMKEDELRDAGIATCDALPVIVHLVGEQHELIMHDAAGGPMYTVKDKSGGIVAGCMAEDALFIQHPELESPTLGVIHTLHSSQMGYVH